MARKTLVACGLIASILYIAMNVFVPMGWPAYNSSSRTISEWSAIDAPTRPIGGPLAVAWTAASERRASSARSLSSLYRFRDQDSSGQRQFRIEGMSWP